MAALRDFVAELMERRGAAVEPIEPDGLAVIAPPELRAIMNWPELARLGFGREMPDTSQYIGMEGGWLDRFVTVLGDDGRYAERQVSLPPPYFTGDPERLLSQALDLPNAIWRLQAQRTAWTRCLILCFHSTALSDEKREAMLWMGFNTGTGAALGAMLARLRNALADNAVGLAPEREVRAAAGEGWNAATMQARVQPALDAAVRAELADFFRAMQRRLTRDHDRLHAYHDDLRRESLKRLAGLAGIPGSKAEADAKRETLRVEAIEREYRAKVDDLRHNYALRVTVEGVQVLELFVPVQRLEVLIRRRKGERLIQLDWHPLTRMAEPPPCDWGLGLGITRLVCDEQLHLTEPAGQAPCLGCGKSFCRACHKTACPKCGHAVAIP